MREGGGRKGGNVGKQGKRGAGELPRFPASSLPSPAFPRSRHFPGVPVERPVASSRCPQATMPSCARRMAEVVVVEPASWKKGIAEMIGTFGLIYIGVMVLVATQGRLLVEVALAHAIILGVMVSATMSIS